MLLNRLEGKGLISVTELRGSKGKRGRESRLEITFPPSDNAVLEDLANAWEDFTSTRLSGFSPEERELYERLAGQVQENIRGILQ